MARICILQNAPHEDAGRLPVALAERAVAFDVVRTWQDAIPARVGHDALVVLGGPMGVYEADAHPFLVREMDLIRAYAAARHPVLGLCLGAQLAAEALGGKVWPGPVFEAGWAPVEVTREGARDPVVGALAGAPAVFHFHGDTYHPPPGAVRLAATPAYAEQAYRLGSVLGLQFHPEVPPETAAAWARADAAMLRDRGLDPDAVGRAPPGAGPALDRVLERLAAFLDP